MTGGLDAVDDSQTIVEAECGDGLGVVADHIVIGGDDDVDVAGGKGQHAVHVGNGAVEAGRAVYVEICRDRAWWA